MTVGIIFAMDEELQEFLSYAKNVKCEKIYNLSFYECVVSGVSCVVALSGIGKVNAGRCAQVIIDKKSVDYVINIGVAGGIDKNLSVLDIVVGDRLVQHDFDVTAFNHEKGYIPDTGTYFESDKRLSSLVCGDSVYHGVIASGDIFCSDIDMSKAINKEFGALCVEMEGAAIAQVCYLCNVPFLVIRSISDVVGNDNKIVYEEFLEESSKVIALKLVNVLKKINNI